MLVHFITFLSYIMPNTVCLLTRLRDLIYLQDIVGEDAEEEIRRNNTLFYI